MSADVNWISLALEGRVEMLGAIFGGNDKRGGGARRPMTSESFRSFAASHNRRYASGARKRGARGKN